MGAIDRLAENDLLLRQNLDSEDGGTAKQAGGWPFVMGNDPTTLDRADLEPLDPPESC